MGCGASVGVPVIGCRCGVCTSSDIRDSRTRSSVVVGISGINIVIDTGPDCREQILKSDITHIDGVIYTHTHYDHCGGIIDLITLHRVCDLGDIPLYGTRVNIEYLVNVYPFLFVSNGKVAKLVDNIVECNKLFSICGVNVLLLEQAHGDVNSCGVVIDRFAYCTDLKSMSDQAMEILSCRKLDLLILECIGYTDYGAHINFDESLNMISIIKPKLVYLTHMSHEISYGKIFSDLNYFSDLMNIEIKPAYDGLKILMY